LHEPERLDSCNESPSPGTYPYRPNTLVTQTGIGSNLHEALIESDNAPYVGGNARLRRTGGLTYWDSGDTRTVTGKTGVDNKPLWEFIPTTLTTASIPAECLRSTFIGPLASKTHLNECFTAYNDGGYTATLFSLDSDGDRTSGVAGDGVYDIQLSPRFSFVPEFHATSFGSGTSPLAIKKFRAAFIQTLYFSCSGSCDVIFNPGETGTGLPGASNKEVDSMTAMIFKDSMLPDEIIKSGPGGTLNGAKIALIR
jgi:hypothetical protein